METNRQYVIRAAKFLGLDLLPAKKGSPEILAFKSAVNGYMHCVVDACNWSQARQQIDAYARNR